MHVRRAFTAALTLFFLGVSAEGAERYTVPFFPAPGASGDPQGVLRIVNDAGEAATVEVFAIADDGTRSGPATVALGAASAAEFDATELRSANAARGLSGGLGSFSGDVRLSIGSDLPVVPLAFVRAPDGSLSAMHDTVRAASSESEGDYRYDVPIFNLSTAVAQAGRLRLINPGDTPAAVTIGSRDDGGSATMGTVQLSLPAEGARTLTAQQLEAGGTGLTGRLGAGIGRWRLSVSSDRPLQVVNIAVSPSGHRNNLSTTAVRGAAPADRAGFDGRFVGENAVLEVQGGQLALAIADNGRFSETMQSDGMFATDEGGYDYVGLGPDAGRLTLDYDDGSQCLANLYFSSRTRGWYASHCTVGGDPDTWSGGNWFVGEDEGGDGDGGPVETTYSTDEALPGVPASGAFIPAHISSGSFLVAGGSTTIELNDGGYFDLSDGTRYTCAAAGGCEIVDGTVTRGAVTGRTPGSGGGGIDRFPVFPAAGRPGDRMYTVGTAIDALILPEATGGNPPLTYSLSPGVPGLSFDAAARRLTGTPTAAGSYAMSYTVTDADGDLHTIRFNIDVGAGGADDHGDTFDTATAVSIPSTTPGVLEEGKQDGDRDYFRVVVAEAGTLTVETAGNADTYGTLFDNTRAELATNDDGGSGSNFRIERQVQAGTYYVEVRGFRPSTTGSYELRVSAALAFEWRFDDDNSRPVGMAYADGRIFVLDDGSDAKVYAYTASGKRDAGADFELHGDNSWPKGIAYADGRFFVVDYVNNKVYAYTASGERDAGADFELERNNVSAAGVAFASPEGIAYADGRFFVVDDTDRKVHAYTASGQRDAAADFELDSDNRSPEGIAYADGRFFVVDSYIDEKVYAYTASGQRDAGADFELADFESHGNNSSPEGITYAEGRFFVVDGIERKVFAHTASGQRDAAADFELHDDNSHPEGIAYADGRFFVPDNIDNKVYAYTAPGERDAFADFGLDRDNYSPRGIVYADGRLFVTQSGDLTVFAYTASGQRDWAADFELDRDNRSHEGIAYADGRFFVVDDTDRKVYAYTASGERDAGADFGLVRDNSSPVGIVYADGRLFVLDTDDTAYAYPGPAGPTATGESPSFAPGSGPGNLAYTLGIAIDPLSLPAASGGDGPLTYSLSPEIPGLRFDAMQRRLTGTPTTADTYAMAYRARDVDGDTATLRFTVTVEDPSGATPDLVVQPPSVSNNAPSAGGSFTLSATVRNDGNGEAPAATLRYYRSTNSTISSSDTEVGTDAVSALSASGTSPESIRLTAPTAAGTYYYGACVDSVSGESDTDNNCSSGVRVSVSSGGNPGGGGGGEGACVEVNDVVELGEGESCTITQALVDKYSLNSVSVRAGLTASCSGGTVRINNTFWQGRTIVVNGLTFRCR